MDRVGIGILSHAHGHSSVYCEVMRNFDDVELVANWDDNIERGQRAAETYGMEYRANADAVIHDPRVDALIVTMETNRHAEFVERAADAGKHILCQKPMATTLEDCDRIIAAVHEYGVKFSMAFQMRHDPVNKKIKELLDEGESSTSFLLRYTISHPGMQTTIVGTKSESHLSSNIAAVEKGPLSEEVYAEAKRRLSEAGERPE